MKASESEEIAIPVYNSVSSTGSSLLYQSYQSIHPACNKLLLGSLSGHIAKENLAKMVFRPEAPIKPLVPYLRYCKKVWDDIRAKQPDLKLWQLGKIYAKMWKDLSPIDKQAFIAEYEKEKADYLDKLRSYYNSCSCQSCLLEVESNGIMEPENNHIDHNQDTLNHSMESMQENYFVKSEKEFSVKDIAAARFFRNHRLMYYVLMNSDAIPNESFIVTNQKMVELKNQVQMLSEHCIKLQQEINEIEQQHNITLNEWMKTNILLDSSHGHRLQMQSPKVF